MIVLTLLVCYVMPMLVWVLISSLVFRRISLFSLFTGLALGLGWSGIVFYIADKFLSHSLQVVTILDSLLLILSLYLIYRFKIRPEFKPFQGDLFEKTTVRVGMVLVALISMGLVLQVYYHPYGNWDAWMIWNVKAKHIAFGGLPRFFQEAHQHLTHPGYPLLLPSIIARGLRFYGDNTLVIPGFIAILYFFILNGLVFNGIVKMSGNIFHGVIGVLALSLTPHVILETAGLYADIPLACYITLASLLVMNGLNKQPHGSYYLLIGLGLGYAVFMKNEGLLFLVVSTLALAVSWYKHLITWKSPGIIFAGLLITLVLLVDLKLSLPREDHLSEIAWDFDTQTAQMLNNAPLVFSYYLRNLLKMGEFLVLMGMIPLLTTYRFSFKRVNLYGLLVVIGILAGYTAIYLLVENPEFLLPTSSKRLFLHVYPLVIVTVVSSLSENTNQDFSLQ